MSSGTPTADSNLASQREEVRDTDDPICCMPRTQFSEMCKWKYSLELSLSVELVARMIDDCNPGNADQGAPGSSESSSKNLLHSHLLEEGGVGKLEIKASSESIKGENFSQACLNVGSP